MHNSPIGITRTNSHVSSECLQSGCELAKLVAISRNQAVVSSLTIAEGTEGLTRPIPAKRPVVSDSTVGARRSTAK
jgi:hypothetical protein